MPRHEQSNNEELNFSFFGLLKINCKAPSIIKVLIISITAAFILLLKLC